MPGNPFRGYLQAYMEHQQNQQRIEQAQQAHDLAVKQLDELHQLHQNELKRQQAELDFNKARTAQTLKQHLMENIASGLQQPPQSSQPTGVETGYGNENPESQNIPGVPTGIPTSLSQTGNQFQLHPEDLSGMAQYLSPDERNISVSTPERMAQLGATAAGTKAAAVTQAELPKTEASVQGRIQAAQIAADQRAKSAADSNAARKYAADLGYEGRKYAADHNAANKSKVDEDELGNSATDVGLGLSDLPTGVNGIHVQSILHNRGDVPFGKKNGGDKLDSLNDLDGLFQDMQDASNQLPQGGVPGITQLKQGISAVKQHLPITTDLKNKVEAVRGRAPEVVRNVFGIGSGRVTNTEINNSLNTLVTGGMTKEQAQENINKLRRDTYTKVYSDILGPMSTRQKVGVLGQHGGLDRWRNVQINYKGQNIPVLRKMQNGKEAMFNTNTGQYEGIEDYK